MNAYSIADSRIPNQKTPFQLIKREFPPGSALPVVVFIKGNERDSPGAGIWRS
jgi:hypothetical protein